MRQETKRTRNEPKKGAGMKIDFTQDEIVLIYDAVCEYHTYSKTDEEESLIEKIKAKLAGRKEKP